MAMNPAHRARIAALEALVEHHTRDRSVYCERLREDLLAEIEFHAKAWFLPQPEPDVATILALLDQRLAEFVTTTDRRI